MEKTQSKYGCYERVLVGKYPEKKENNLRKGDVQRFSYWEHIGKITSKWMFGRGFK